VVSGKADLLINNDLLFETMFFLLNIAFLFGLEFADLSGQFSAFSFQLLALDILANFSLHFLALLVVVVFLRLLGPLDFFEGALLNWHLAALLLSFGVGMLIQELLTLLTLLRLANSFCHSAWFIKALLCWDHIAFLAVLMVFEINRIDALLISDCDWFVIAFDALDFNALFILLSDHVHFVDLVTHLLERLAAFKNIVFLVDNMVVNGFEQFTLLLSHIKAFMIFILFNLCFAIFVINLLAIRFMVYVASLHKVRNALILVDYFLYLMAIDIIVDKFIHSNRFIMMLISIFAIIINFRMTISNSNSE